MHTIWIIPLYVVNKELLYSLEGNPFLFDRLLKLQATSNKQQTRKVRGLERHGKIRRNEIKEPNKAWGAL